MTCIFFDLDNTLTDRRATVTAYAAHFWSEFRDALLEDVTADFLAATFNRLDCGGYETHAGRSAAIRNLNIWRHPQAASELSAHWQGWVPSHSMPMNGMDKCLSELLSMVFRLCLVTNGKSKNQRDKVKNLSLEKYFEKVVISEEVGSKKPQAAIFEFALRDMGCSATEAFFIGDHPVNDYLGSTQLGITGIWFAGAHPWPENYDVPISIQHLDELSSLLGKLTGA